jgi:hypothetical protein
MLVAEHVDSSGVEVAAVFDEESNDAMMQQEKS